MGGTTHSALVHNNDGSTSAASRMLSLGQMIKALESRRVEFVERMELRHTFGTIEELQDQLIQARLRPPKYDSGSMRRKPSADGGASSAMSAFSSSTAEVKKIQPYASKKRLRGAISGQPMMQISDVVVCTPGSGRNVDGREGGTSGVEEELKDAVIDFLQLAQGGERPTQAAVLAATQLLTKQLDTLLSVREGEDMERHGNVMLFLNNAFTRIDYYVYSYSAVGTFGFPGSISGASYVAELSVVDPSDLSVGQIDFLLTQAFSVVEQKRQDDRYKMSGDNGDVDKSNGGGGVDLGTPSELELIMRIKLMLFENAAVSRLMRRPDVSLDQLQELIMMLVAVQKSAGKLFKSLPYAEGRDRNRRVNFSTPATGNEAAMRNAIPLKRASAAAQSDHKPAYARRRRDREDGKCRSFAEHAMTMLE